MLKDLKNKKLWKSVLLIFVLIVIFFMPVIIDNHGVLIFYGDSYEQFYQFYLGGWERVHSLDFSDWTWGLGLGGNIYSYSLYYLTSIFFYITTLFPKEYMQYLFLVLNILRMLAIYIFTYLWAKKLTKNNLSRFLAATIMTFSGWVFFYLHYNYFVEAYLYFPLILYFTEKYLQDKKFIGLVISVFLLTFASYYFMYMYVTFLMLYTLFRYLVINKANLKIKPLLFDALKYFVFVMLGIGLACFILVPSAYTILDNPRLDANTVSLFQHITLNDLYKFISSMFIPVFDRLEPNYLIMAKNHSYLGWAGGAGLFSMILTVYLLPILFRFKRELEVKMIFLFYLVLFILLLFPSTWVLFQGTVDTRWLFIFVILNAYSVIYIVDKYIENKINNKYFLIGGFVALAMMGLIFLYSYRSGYFTDIEKLKEVFKLMLIEVVFIVIYSLGFIKKKNYLIVLVICAEVLLSGSTFVKYNEPRDYTLFEDGLKDREMIDQIEEVDNDFFRVIYEDSFYTTPNEPFSKNYAGIAFYNSIYTFSQEEYLNRLKDNWSMPMMAGRSREYNMLGVKYYYTRDYEALLPFGYQYYEHINGFDIYENKYFLPLAFKMDKTINEDYVRNLDELTQDRIMMNYIVTDKSENTEFVLSDSLVHMGTFDTSEPIDIKLGYDLTIVNVYIVCDYMPATKVTLLLDDEIQYLHEYNNPKYLDFYLDGAIKMDEMKLDFYYQSSETCDVYLEYDFGKYEQWHEVTNANSLENIVVDKNVVTMNTTVDKDEQYIYTSIPYISKGWKLYVNDEIHDIEKVDFGFIGFKLNRGEYDIKLVYQAPYKNLGIGISLICLFGFIMLIFNNKKRG